MTPSLACTGSSARWCPVCGDCACGPRYEGDGADGERTLDDAGCPLHGASSTHARDTAPDLAAKVLALAEALATAERDRDAAREAWATLVAAVREEREAERGHAAVRADDASRGRHLRAAEAAVDKARHATDALISAAPAPTTVPAEVVRAYLRADARSATGTHADATALAAARTALDAALATTTTTPKESR